MVKRGLSLPVERIGKQRESLTINSEEYKKQFLRYLQGRQYYNIKTSSDVEGTFADVVLTRKGESREYWLEIKTSPVSLGDADFLRQLAKYLAAYLAITPSKRFKLILACYKLTDWESFKNVFEYLEDESVKILTEEMLKVAETHDKVIIEKARADEIKSFIEDTTVKEADLKSLEFAEAKILPKAPSKPSLAEAEYAETVIKNFGDVSPLQEREKLYLNLFNIELPPKLFAAKSVYDSATEMYADTNIIFPPHDFRDGDILTFNEFFADNPLSYVIKRGTIKAIDILQFSKEENNQETIKTIINRWIRDTCKKKNLDYDKRTKTYYYHRKLSDTGIVTAKWKPKIRTSVRELTRPMKTNDGRINFWVHRGAEISATTFAGQFYVQIRPRFLFSWDGLTLMEGPDADVRDRKFRKSKYNRNPNQLYDARFWCRHVFPETENLGVVSLVAFIDTKYSQIPKILEQENVECECKPNEDKEVDVEALDSIDTNPEQLSDYLEE